MPSEQHDPSKIARRTRQTLQGEEEALVVEAGEEAEVVDVVEVEVTQTVTRRMLPKEIKVKSHVLSVINLVIMHLNAQVKRKMRKLTLFKRTKNPR